MPPVGTRAARGESAQFPNVIIEALKTGKMQAMASGLSDDDISAVAVFITGQAADARFTFQGGREHLPGGRKPTGRPSWNGWSPDKQNASPSGDDRRRQHAEAEGQWAFAYQGGRYGQPTVGNRASSPSP
jgi:hypothetical protein